MHKKTGTCSTRLVFGGRVTLKICIWLDFIIMQFQFCLQEMLKDLNLGEMKSGLPVLAVSLALEGKASHREMTSKLLHDLCGTVLSVEDLLASFDKLLQELPELVLDTPKAPQVRMHLM